MRRQYHDRPSVDHTTCARWASSAFPSGPLRTIAALGLLCRSTSCFDLILQLDLQSLRSHAGWHFATPPSALV